MRTTITISRQMGSGGSYIGQVIASRLGLKYVDREVLNLAAKEFGCDEAVVVARSERLSSFWEKILGGLTFGVPESRYVPPPMLNFSDEELFEKQTEILKRIAGKDDCLVIGWAGVLPRITQECFQCFVMLQSNFALSVLWRSTALQLPGKRASESKSRMKCARDTSLQ